MIEKATFNFLEQVAIYNERDWFQAHKDEYELARQNILNFVAAIIPGLAKIDPLIPADLSAKDCLMRIYRDVRFSKNKAPYKTNFGIGFSPRGKNFDGPGYYLHVEPGKSFVAAGSWMPEAAYLKNIRQEIDYNGTEFHEIVDSVLFKSVFGQLSEEDQLKTSPKGYAPDHIDIRYLKLKSFTVSRPLSDGELMNPAATASVLDIFKVAGPLVKFLRNASV